jgi:hypothetical protein
MVIFNNDQEVKTDPWFTGLRGFWAAQAVDRGPTWID